MTNVALMMTMVKEQHKRCGNIDTAARIVIRAFPALAFDVMDRVGSWPSSEPEIAAIQRNY